MNERGARTPFYAPPRRKTSAEIISEARAAICAEMKAGGGGVAGAAGAASAAGVLRALRTRRPFTPREPQRTLFTDRTRTRAPRPPSAFDLKYLSLSEDSEDPVTDPGLRSPDEYPAGESHLVHSQLNSRQKPVMRIHTRPTIERSGEGWAGLPKLPHLSGRSKPLHRRNTSSLGADGVFDTNHELAQAISIIRPLGAANSEEGKNHKATKSLSPESGSRRKNFAINKSLSCDSGAARAEPLGDVAVKHLAVQLPTTSHDTYEKMSLLELGEALCARTEDVGRTLALLHAAQAAAGRGAGRGGLRDHVLRALYTHIDSDDERVLVAIARTMFIMRVTGTHLAAACKLIFKIARNDKNDHFFRDSDLLELLVEGCGRAEPLSESECCVYGAGALRFLALEPQLCALAHRAGALHLAALHLKILNTAKSERPRQMSEQATHALYQVTGALRNLAGGAGECARAFASSGALAELVTALQTHTDRDVLTNVARCLSVVSAEETCCAWLCASGAAARALLRALAACSARAPLTVRLAYTLGNMAAAEHQARINIYKENGSVDVLLTILESYTARNDTDGRDGDPDPDFHLVGSDLGGSDGSNEDVLIKTVRVVANLCLSEAAGRGLAHAHAERTVRALLACLQLAEKLPPKITESTENEHESWTEGREELATAALATLNNVTFYLESPPAGALDDVLDSVCKATCRWVCGAGGAGGAGGGGAAREAVRALGNLTRSARAAQLAVLEGALDALPSFQRHEDESVRCAAAGVLVNVCGAGAGAGAGAARAGAAAARALRVAAAAGDAPCAALLARALWNAHAHRPLQPADAHYAAGALASFIDDDSVFEACEVAGRSARGPGGRRASDPHLHKQHVKFDLDNNNYPTEMTMEGHDPRDSPLAVVRAYSVEDELNVERRSDEDCIEAGCSGEDLGFEEGEVEECECQPCRRLAAWEELVAIAIPLLEKLKPPRADASVGTD